MMLQNVEEFQKMWGNSEISCKMSEIKCYKIFNFWSKCGIFTEKWGNVILHFSRKSSIFCGSIRSIGQKCGKIGQNKAILAVFRLFLAKFGQNPANPWTFRPFVRRSSDLRWQKWVIWPNPTFFLAYIQRFYSIAGAAGFFIIGA